MLRSFGLVRGAVDFRRTGDASAREDGTAQLFGQVPLAEHGCGRDAERLGRLFHRQTGEIAQFDDLALALICRLQLAQRLIQQDQVRTLRRTGEVDFLELRRKIVPALNKIAPWPGMSDAR